MSYLIDTNVLSEIRRRSTNAQVLDWQSKQDLAQCWVSVLSFAEILNGTELVRKTDPTFASTLDEWNQKVLRETYHGRILSVTLDVCEARAKLNPERTLPFADSLIAATAQCHGLKLVTRHTEDFQDLGIELINPWETPSD